MNNTSVNYNITNAENGFIVNRTIDQETEKDNTFSSSFTSETYVFTKWADVIDWLMNAEAQKA